MKFAITSHSLDRSHQIRKARVTIWKQWEVQVTVMRSHDFACEMPQFSAWTWEATVVITDSFKLAAIKQR